MHGMIATNDPQHTLSGDTLARLGVSVPLRPGPTQDLLWVSSSDRSGTTALVEADPVFASRLLGVVFAADAADGATDGAMRSASDVVSELGSRHVRAVGLALGVQTLVLDPSVGEHWLKGWWNVSLAKAQAAQLAHGAMDPKCGRQAYLLGLISDIALPLLMRLDPGFYRDVMPRRKENQSWCDVERHRFGVDHAQAGAYLLSKWNVPAPVCRLVRAHHQTPAGDENLSLRTALYLSGLMPHEEEGAVDNEPALQSLHGRLLANDYATPTSFLESARFAASKRSRGDSRRDHGRELDLPGLLVASATDCVELVTRAHRLETARSRQAEDLSTLRMDAYTDPLTKVLNRRGFFDLAQQRIDKSGGGLSACCMLLDLNEFKPVNDKYGHDVGDKILRGLAKLLRRSVSRTDLIGRLGGDEFVVLITDLTEEGARSAAERLYKTCHGVHLRVSDDLTLPVLLSLGAVYDTQLGESVPLDQMMAAADELMYRQKRTRKAGLLFGRVTPDVLDDGIAVDAPADAEPAKPFDPQI